MENNLYINHSGGCSGSDMEWENRCLSYGIKTVAYSFPGHTQYGANPKILTESELEEGWQQVLLCEKPIKRPLYKIKYTPYVRNLLCRNWFQVKNADSIYAIGRLVKGNNKLVDGGTGWAVQMAINHQKPVYLFEQTLDRWMIYYYPENVFIKSTVHLSERFK
jgi:hypothetical protein